jgi:hypothetical protein
MKNSFGFPWHGSAFSSFFFTGRVDLVIVPNAGKAPFTPNSACFFFGINKTPPIAEAVLKEFDAGAPEPIGANEAKP